MSNPTPFAPTTTVLTGFGRGVEVVTTIDFAARLAAGGVVLYGDEYAGDDALLAEAEAAAADAGLVLVENEDGDICVA